MISSRSVLIALFVVMALVCVAQSRTLQYNFDDTIPDAFRYAQWSEIPHKRVPSAGDMMVRFGKRSE